MGLVDSNGNAVVKYSCTAYGEQISCTDTSGINLGEINKFRYKGYYYEEHIGLFYLKSRFYDPTIGRFISPDNVDYLNPKSVNGLNLYCYCNNDSVNKVDPSGHLFIELAALGTVLYYASLIALTVVATGLAIYAESQTHIIGNAINGTIDILQDEFEEIKEQIVVFVETLVPKNNYFGGRQWHHIVAQRDPRAWLARTIITNAGIDINDSRNLVYMKNDYHRIIHTNSYYFILNSSLLIGYWIDGSEGVEKVLEVYKDVLGGL